MEICTTSAKKRQDGINAIAPHHDFRNISIYDSDAMGMLEVKVFG